MPMIDTATYLHAIEAKSQPGHQNLEIKWHHNATRGGKARKPKAFSYVERNKIKKKKVTQFLPDSDLFSDLHLDFRSVTCVG